MIELADTLSAPVLRADLTDDSLWEQLQDDITSPTDEGFLANVTFVVSPELAGLDEVAIARALPRRYPHDCQHAVSFVFDAITVAAPDHPLLVIDLSADAPAEPFRATPRQIQSIENNLSIANMDFIEFARAVDPDGVFRGF